MKIYDDFGFDDLLNKCWSIANVTLQTIQENNKEDELMSYLQDIFCNDDIPSLTQINDFLWFESNTIYQDLGITENTEDEEEEEGEENE